MSDIDPAQMSSANGGGFLQLTIEDKATLYAAYMPFVKNGALFIPTQRSYKLGDDVFVLLSLLDEPEKLPIAGKVAWITPKGAHGTRKPGIGIQFNSQDNGVTRIKIETLLGGALRSDRHTNTM